METHRYTRIKQELLISLRGKQRTKDLSARLGYGFDQVRRWELTKKQLRWDEFCDYCEILQIPLARTLIRFTVSPHADSNLPHSFVRELRGRYPELSLESLAGKIHCHVSALKRYLSEEASPDLEVIFALLDIRRSWLSQFIFSLAPPGIDATVLTGLLKPEFNRTLAETSHPLACAVEMCLAVQGYLDLKEHSDEFIASRVGADPGEVRLLLEKMLSAGTILREDSGKFRVNYQTLNTEGLSPAAASEIIHFWTSRAALRYAVEEPVNHGPVRGLTSYRVVATSADSMQKINEVLVRAGDQILAILEADPRPADDVRVILLQTFSAADIPSQTYTKPEAASHSSRHFSHVTGR